jgi:predicted  nucleic acid-binding Zn-ribbon protein
MMLYSPQEQSAMSLQDRLHQLFLLDQQVRGLSSGLEAARRRLAAKKGKLDQFATQQKELAEQVKQAAAKAANLEGEAADIDARIAALRARMNSCTNNKEYQALLVEVNTIKIDKGKKEEEALKAMEERDRLESQLKDLEAKAADQAKLVAVAEKEVADRLAEVGQKLDEVTAQRDAAGRNLPAEALAAFNRACEIHDGEAMAAVVEESRRHNEYSCGGCYMGLPAERVSALMSRRDELISCPSCGRILYVEQELRASLTRV